jgi:hypothetical protein
VEEETVRGWYLSFAAVNDRKRAPKVYCGSQRGAGRNLPGIVARTIRDQQLATPQLLDRYRGDLSYSLHLLIDFDVFEVDFGGRLSAMGGVGPLVVVEGDPAADANRSCPRVHDMLRTV